MAYNEHCRFKDLKLGGVGVELETDAFTLGKKSKNGLGQKFKNKCGVHYLCERDGLILLEVFPKPNGGSESSEQMKIILEGNIEPSSILHSDTVRGLSAYISDHPELDIVHIRVNHSEAKHSGFTWYLWLDSDDGNGFEHLTDGKYRILRAGTQHADGYAGMCKTWLNGKRGIRRENIKGYVKESQFRRNCNSENCDIYNCFLLAWGLLETDLREGRITKGELDEMLNWNFQAYDTPEETIPRWKCVGCPFETSGEKWRESR